MRELKNRRMLVWALTLGMLLGGGLDAALAEGGAKNGDQKVRISLKNGAVFDGIIREGLLYERLEGGWFKAVDEKKARRSDGIRIWYPGFARGFVFLRKGDIRTLEKLDRLETKDAAEIEQIVSDKAKRAIHAYKEVLLAREQVKAERQVPKDLAERAGPSAEELSPDLWVRTPGIYPLLDRFPPEDGWGEEKAQQLERRKWLIGVFPNSQEKAFLSVFDNWRDQYGQWETEQRNRQIQEAKPAPVVVRAPALNPPAVTSTTQTPDPATATPTELTAEPAPTQGDETGAEESTPGLFGLRKSRKAAGLTAPKKGRQGVVGDVAPGQVETPGTPQDKKTSPPTLNPNVPRTPKRTPSATSKGKRPPMPRRAGKDKEKEEEEEKEKKDGDASDR